MLALTIRTNGFVKIGDDIVVRNNSGRNIQIAIEAPREIEIVRSDSKTVKN